MSFSISTLDGLLRDLSELHERKSELEAELTQVNDLIEEVSERIFQGDQPDEYAVFSEFVPDDE